MSPKSSNAVLVDYLTACDPIIVSTTAIMLKSKLSKKNKQFVKYHNEKWVSKLDSKSRRELAAELVKHYKYFGSNSIAYATRKAIGEKAGVSYLSILRYVSKFLNKQLKPPFNIPI